MKNQSAIFQRHCSMTDMKEGEPDTMSRIKELKKQARKVLEKIDDHER